MSKRKKHWWDYMSTSRFEWWAFGLVCGVIFMTFCVDRGWMHR